LALEQPPISCQSNIHAGNHEVILFNELLCQSVRRRGPGVKFSDTLLLGIESIAPPIDHDCTAQSRRSLPLDIGCCDLRFSRRERFD
jgi:hypothetical protein